MIVTKDAGLSHRPPGPRRGSNAGCTDQTASRSRRRDDREIEPTASLTPGLEPGPDEPEPELDKDEDLEDADSHSTPGKRNCIRMPAYSPSDEAPYITTIGTGLVESPDGRT